MPWADSYIVSNFKDVVFGGLVDVEFTDFSFELTFPWEIFSFQVVFFA